MNKIIPFKKEIVFDTNLSEITSISLEHTLSLNNNDITGEFIINGEYKMTREGTNTDKFEYKIPFNISMDDRYILDNAKIDIDDFYYEILNDKVLSVNIDVIVDDIEEKEITEVNEMEEKERCVEEEDIQEESSNETNLFDNIDTFEETYKSYKVYIVREGDTVEKILEKYSKTKEELEEYNDFKEIKIGDKIVIP